MATKVPSGALRGPFRRLAEKLKVVEFDVRKYNSTTKGGLEPNQYYKTGKTGAGKPKYEYVTDDKGRIRGAYAENLKLKPQGQKRGSHNSKSKGKQAGDDAGHLIADQFDGSGGLDNIVSQARDLNQGAWRNMEEGWADALRAGKKVEVFTEVHYVGDAARPSGFTVRTVIDGVPQPVTKFSN
ncbi:DNA/RNA non-specific endonuclease [Propionibacteriaceae bacterium G1746]|uniref:DNA/RNA non-specific endonuclease n=1 Tax=Aestuariimicrobium sp. G57 TaxID=3418485 RepID=UPI003C1E4A76